MTHIALTAALLTALVSGCSPGILEPDDVPPRAAASVDDLAALAAQVNEDDQLHAALQGAAYDADAVAPLVRLVPAGGDLAGDLADAFCSPGGDPDACFGRLDGYTGVLREAGVDARVVGVVEVSFGELFAEEGPGKCPPKPIKSEPGPSLVLEGRLASVVERGLPGGEPVGVVEVYAFTGERPDVWEGEVQAGEVAPVGVEAREPLAPAEYGPTWAEANAEATRARYIPMPGGPCCLCIPDPLL